MTCESIAETTMRCAGMHGMAQTKYKRAKEQRAKEEPKVRQVLRQALQAQRKKKRKRSSAAVCGTVVRDF